MSNKTIRTDLERGGQGFRSDRKEPLGPHEKRLRRTCPDCGRKRICTIIEGKMLGCNNCQDERRKQMALRKNANFTSREYLNKVMKNGPDKFVHGKDAEDHIILESGKTHEALKVMELLFIREDGWTVGTTVEHALEVFLIDPAKWVGVVTKPSTEAKDPRTWMKDWNEILKADKPEDIRKKLNLRLVR